MDDRTGLLTDRYGLTMLDSWVRDGSSEHRATFEAFARRLPEGRRYGVLAGLGRLLPMIERFTFSAEEVGWLQEKGVLVRYFHAFRARRDEDSTGMRILSELLGRPLNGPAVTPSLKFGVWALRPLWNGGVSTA